MQLGKWEVQPAAERWKVQWGPKKIQELQKRPKMRKEENKRW